jgi:hypothetical protein
MRRRKREEWMQSVAERQHNTVFPDTAINEARFWRNIISGNQRLSLGQKLGILLIYLALGVAIWVWMSTLYSATSPEDSTVHRILGAYGLSGIVLSILGGILLVGYWVSRRNDRLKVGTKSKPSLPR